MDSKEPQQGGNVTLSKAYKAASSIGFAEYPFFLQNSGLTQLSTSEFKRVRGRIPRDQDRAPVHPVGLRSKLLCAPPDFYVQARGQEQRTPNRTGRVQNVSMLSQATLRRLINLPSDIVTSSGAKLPTAQQTLGAPTSTMEYTA